MHTCLLTILYLILVKNVFDYENLSSIFALILSLALYLSYTFLINDICDMPYDRIAGKKQTVFALPKPILIVVLLMIILLSFSITILLLKQPLFLIVFTIAYFLATFYSARPIRFKDRGALGVLCDSLVEKVIPVLSIFTFFNYFNIETLFFLIFFFILQFKIILHHQVIDFEGDLKSKVSTFAVKYGRERTSQIILNYLRPVVSVLFALFFLMFATKISFFIYFVPGLIIGYFLTEHLIKRGLYAPENMILPLPRHLAYAYGCLMCVIPLYFAFLVSAKFLPYIIILAISISSQYYLIVNQYRRLLYAVSNAVVGV